VAMSEERWAAFKAGAVSRYEIEGAMFSIEVSSDGDALMGRAPDGSEVPSGFVITGRKMSGSSEEAPAPWRARSGPRSSSEPDRCPRGFPRYAVAGFGRNVSRLS